MFQGLGGFGTGDGGAGGALGGGSKASTGFGRWYSDMQEAKEVELTELEAGAAVETRDGVGVWRFWQGSEKKTDGPSQTSALLPVFPFTRQEAQATEADTMIMGMSYAQRFKCFVVALLLSILFFAMAFAIGLPALAFKPSKFALSFTLGSLCFMGSFAMLKGPTKHLKSMLSRDRLPFSLAYLGSMGGTIYACMIQSYLLVVFCSGIQLLALLWYFASFVPGGSRGMGYFVGAITKTVRYTVKPCFDVCSRTICFCLGGGGS